MINNQHIQPSKQKTQTSRPMTALITGASSGIGLELARLFAKDGVSLVLVGCNQQNLESLAIELEQQFPIRAFSLPIDIAEQQAVQKIINFLAQQSIEIDVLVNNADTQVYGEFNHANLEHLSTMLQVNNTALIELTHRLLPGMINRKFGYILNLGSTGSFAPGPLNAVYCASKTFVLSFSQALGAELSGTGISVTTLCPDATKTNFINRHGLENVRIFRYAMAANRVAEIGYRAMWQKKPVVAGWVNLSQVISFQFMAPFLPLTPPVWLMAIDRLFIGKTMSSRKPEHLVKEFK